VRYRKHKNLNISEIGIGCYSLSGVYGKKDIDEFKKMIVRAYELGVNFFDTAEAYGNAEQILGEVVEPFRKNIHIATKVGVKEGIRPNLSKEYIKKACEESLRNLKTDYIDLYQIHFDDPERKIEEIISTLEELVKEGKIIYYGVGHLPKERVEEFCNKGNIFSILMELSAVSYDSREKLLPLCEKYDVGGIAFSTTGRGILTGKINKETKFEPNDIRNMDPLFQREKFESGLRVCEKFKEIGGKYGKTSSQIAIAWVLSQPKIICALTGPSKISHLEENLKASDFSISKEDLEDIEKFLKEENDRLKFEQKLSVKNILLNLLPDDPNKAFVDLVYAIETSILLGLISEEKILSNFYELFEIRKSLDDKNSLKKLKNIQVKIKNLISLN
jgi:aryl-alcohol dehydrogenase-like predicted oxidoreductase